MLDRHFDQPTRLNSTSFTGIFVRVGSRSMLDENSRLIVTLHIFRIRSRGARIRVLSVEIERGVKPWRRDAAMQLMRMMLRLRCWV